MIFMPRERIGLLVTMLASRGEGFQILALQIFPPHFFPEKENFLKSIQKPPWHWLLYW
jgi:hypothetical protein